MKSDSRPIRCEKIQDIDESLAAWLGWFASQPLPAALASIVEQLEAAYGQAEA
jgi:hypothetical protein